MTGASSSAGTDLDQALAELWLVHRGTNLDRIAQLESLAAAALRGPLDEAQRSAGEQAAHKLAGSLGTFGFPAGSRAASAIESMLATQAVDVRLLAEAVVALRAAVTDTPRAASSHESRRAASGLLIVSGDATLVDGFTTEATLRALPVAVVSDLGAALATVQSTPPRAVLVDLLAGDLGDIRLAELAARVPTLVLAGAAAAAHRVAAARAGTVGFLDRAIPPHTALTFVDRLTADEGPIRVLTLCCAARVAVVRSAFPAPRYRLAEVHDPTRWWDAVEQVRPHAVLIDDTCEPGALDACAVLRADPRLQGTTIVVLAAPTRAGEASDVTLACALDAGADEFLPDTVDAEELRMRVQARIDRAGAAAAAQSSPKDQSIGGESPAGATGGIPSPRRASAGSVAAPPEAFTTDVVVVEDDDSVADVVRYALGLRGLRTHRITDGVDAAAQLCDGRVRARLILLDVGLPGLDGFAVLGRLREAGVLAATPVIMLTARSSETETLTALGLGATEHLAKPFSVPILLSRIIHALDRRV